jgi:multiple sugar transport system substrate-binding protein/raffinose/stachyose/melibiose transport system substrate-binding protein
MRKIILALLIIFAITLTSCASEPATEAPVVEEEVEAPVEEPTEVEEAEMPEEHEQVVLRMMVFESPALTAEYWDNAIAQALELVPDYISVEKITSPSLDRDAYAKQLQATDQFPDMLMAVTISDFAQAGLLTPFDEDFLQENFIVPDGAMTDGVSYHPPNGAQIIPFIFYNKAIFEEVGVEVPTTYAEFVEVSQAIKDAGHTPILMCGAEPWCGSFPVVALFSADVFGNDPDWMIKRKAGEVSFSDPEVVAAFQKFQDLVDAGLIDEGGLGTDFATANQAFYDGEAAMYFQGSWFIGYMEPEVSANTGVFLLPQDDGDIYVPIYVGGGTRMSALSEHPEELKMFAEAFASNPNALKTNIELDALFPMLKGITMADWQNDYGVEVSDLYIEAYEGYVTNEDAVKVSTFTWSNNDDDVIAGMKEEIYTAIQNIFLGADVAEEMARLDQLWGEAAAALGQ